MTSSNYSMKPSRKRKASLKDTISKNSRFRWSNKENIPTVSEPLPDSPPEKPLQETTWKSKVARLFTRLSSTQRALQREKQKSAKHAATAKAALTREREATEQSRLTISALKHQNQRLEHTHNAMNSQLTRLMERKQVSQRQMHALKEKIRRFRKNAGRAIEKAKKSYIVHLRKKGTYTSQARSLARTLVHAGCAPRKVGRLIANVAGALGVKVVGEISSRTVGRTQVEGLVAATVQAGYELGVAKSVTISQDSTSNRHVNFESHHYALQVPDYSKGETVPSTSSEHKVRLLKVDSTLDHSSEKSRDAWFQQLRGVAETYEESPLAQRAGAPKFSLRHFALILKGMHGDHASAEKGTVKLMGEWKHEETLLDLGEQRLLEVSDLAGLLVYLNEKKAEWIAKLGGMSAWEALSQTERSLQEEKLMQAIKLEVGQDVYNALSDYDRRMLDMFIWAGCCMHKDQNSFKGGNTAMMAYWVKHGLQAPLLLANKFNAQKIRDILDPSRKNTPVTEEEQETLEKTTRGGVKTCAIAGCLLNNKDDKKGLGDTYQIFREALELVKEICARFPDTSNTRFNSHAEAAAELLLHLPFYLQFLEYVRDSKKLPGWTNIEVNLYNALKDTPTLTELAAMVLYSQSVTHPYMREVRGPGTEKTNVLDLGPLHVRVRAHCEKIIANPELLVSPEANYELATLDGKKWEHTKAVNAIKAMLPNLPHLRGVVQAFFEGALATWVRFSSEFAPGGLIDSANAEEKRLAWMPSTNDTNEGALGAYRVYMRNKPSTTVLQYNAYAVWERNDTQSFMESLFTKEDEAYIRKKAREWDSQGKERERKKALREHGEKQVAAKRAKEAQKVKDAEDRRTRLLKVVISTQDASLMSMTVPQIDDQLDALKEIYGDTEIPNKTARGKKADKAKHLEDAIRRFASRKVELQSIIEKNLINIVTSWDEEDEMEGEMED